MSTLFKTSDVARWASVDLKTVHNWVDKGQITAGRTPGGHLRFTPGVVKALLEGMGVPLPAEVQAACAASQS